MNSVDYKWNEKVENFNMKLNKLKDEIHEYKRSSTHLHLLKNKNEQIFKMKNDTKKKEITNVRNMDSTSNINKKNNGGCALKMNKKINSNSHEQIGIMKKVINTDKFVKSDKISRNNKVSNSKHFCINKNNNNHSNTNHNNKININSKVNSNINNRNTVNNEKTMKLHFPSTKEISNKFVKTENQNQIQNKRANTKNLRDIKNPLNLHLRNKRKNERTPKINENKWLISTKHVKLEKKNSNEKVLVFEKRKSKNKSNKFLYLEGEEGNLHVYPVYADEEVGFQSISKMEDDNLSQVKKENQDDDDIKTTKHLAQWSSELVHKYLEEAIEQSKSIFKTSESTMKWRKEEIIRRMQS